jgi:pilus assembly protein Flp/PilA
MTNFIRKFVNDESGASAAEYALILVVIGLAIVAAAVTLSGAIGSALTDAASCINTGTSAGCARG